MTGFRKYLYVLLITAALFGSAWYLSSYFTTRKLNEVKTIQNKVAVDILSSETQYDLLTELSCEDLTNSVFSSELSMLTQKISYAEQNLSNDEDVELLKKQYTILQVKDFLLTKRVGERCKQAPISILYFFNGKETCNDCVKQGYVLDAIRRERPEVRVYSFDYNLDLSTIKALTSIYKVGDILPALVINGTTYSGYQTLEQVRSILPMMQSSTQ